MPPAHFTVRRWHPYIPCDSSLRGLLADRTIFAGTLEQIREDAQACAKIGAHELIYDVTFEKRAANIEGWLEWMENLRNLV